MSGFAPSASAAARALPNAKIVQQVHPGGAAGVKFSLEEVARRVAEARNDPRLKGWAGQVLVAAGKPRGVRAQMQALLDAFRKRTMYVPDPTQTEMIASPRVTLCLDEHGLCMPAGDCDDRVVALAGAAKSLDFDVRIIGQAFNNEPVASHVIFSVRDPDVLENGGWLKIDPSSETWRVGEAAYATKEWELDPMTMSSTGLGGVGSSDAGDFIGIGRLPAQGMGQAAAPETYVIGQDRVPFSAPVGSLVREQPGSPYTTTCTKQADGSWQCTNGSSFAPGELETRVWKSCQPGETFVNPGLCVPAQGLKLSDGTLLMPDGSSHLPSGAILHADGSYTSPTGTTVSATGQVSLSVADEIASAKDAAWYVVTHPLETAGQGATAIGQGAGRVISNLGAGFAQGLLTPTEGGWALLIVATAATTVAAVVLLGPLVKEGATSWVATRARARSFGLERPARASSQKQTRRGRS